MRITYRHLPILGILLFSAAFTSRNPKRTIPRPATTEVLVAAAADLKFAMDSLIAVFTAKNPSLTVKPIYGSSGSFFEQINNGAPFDIFFSADIDYPKKLKDANKTLG